ncbi:MAG: methyltransferase domain-containing protein [Planctomycetaceae bacterium]
MKLRHFETLRPVCPVCRTERSRPDSRLVIGSISQSDDTSISEGLLLCESPDCQREYPIIDGIPLIIPHIRSWIESNIMQIQARDDLSDLTESLLTDCCGPGSAFETARQHVSSYTWDHYAEFDPDEVAGNDQPGLIVRLLDQSLQIAQPLAAGPVLDMGCGVGRTSFALAERTSDLVLGIDLHYAMLRVAARVLATGTVRYPRRRVGIVYDRREFPVEFPNSHNVDFWGCDANALPFVDGQFAATFSMNVLDCANSPMNYLQSVARVTTPGGQVVLACPYDWSAGATPIEGWLGGHSQRSELKGSSDALLRSMLTPGSPMHAFPGLRLTAEADNLPWHVRLHDRSTMKYSVHLIVAQVESA